MVCKNWKKEISMKKKREHVVVCSENGDGQKVEIGRLKNGEREEKYGHIWYFWNWEKKGNQKSVGVLGETRISSLPIVSYGRSNTKFWKSKSAAKIQKLRKRRFYRRRKSRESRGRLFFFKV